MTPSEFYETSVLSLPREFFNDATSQTPEVRVGGRISEVPAKYIRSAMAAVAIGLISLAPPVVSASTLSLEVSTALHAEAAVQVPRLTPGQARAAKLFRKAFEDLPTGAEAEEDDPDYGF